jgi:PAS domain S-box-containing protein
MAIRSSISWTTISNHSAGLNRFRLARRLVPVLCRVAALLMVFPHSSTLGADQILVSQNAKHPPLRLLAKVEEIRNLSREEAARGYPVHLRAVVTFADPDQQMLFVQDRTRGIFVDLPLEFGLSLKAGELVDIKGSTQFPDFAPDIGNARFNIVGHSTFPIPIRSSAESLESVTMDCMWVEVEGVVRSLGVKGVPQYALQYWEQDISTPRLRTPNPTTLVWLTLAVGRSRIPVYVPHSQALNPDSYLGARVRVRGVRGSFFNQRNQVVGVYLFVPGLAQIQVVGAPPPIPAVAMSSLMQYTAHETLNQRVKVGGFVTLQNPGRELFIANAGSGTRVETSENQVLHPGDYVEVVGFPTMGDFSTLLQDATVRRLHSGPALSPIPITAEKALTAENDGDLVRIDGRLESAGVVPEGPTWALKAGSVPFLARLPATSLANRKLPPIEEGSLLRLTGVCVVNADQNGRPESFELLLRSPGDVMVLESPAWWTARHALTVLGLSLVVVLVVLGWVYALHRRVNQQAKLIRQKTAAEVAIAKRFEYVARAANDALWEVDLVAGAFWASPTYAATYGALPDQIPVDPMAMAEGVHPDDRAKVVVGMSAALQNRHTKWEAEYRRRRVDGSYADVYARAYLERDEGGRPKRLIGALTDITARKRAEEELRSSRQLLETTLYSLRDAAFIMSFDRGEILDCNPAAVEIFGYSREEMVGRDTQFLHLDEAARHEFRKRLTAAVAEKGYLQQFEFHMRRKDGTIFPTSHSVTPLRDNQGNHTGWVSLVQDITERKRAEEALRRANAYNRSLIEASLDPLMTISTEGRITDVNAATEGVTGRSRQELIGTDFSDYFTDAEKARAGYQQVFREGWVQDYELEVRHRNGQVTPVLYNSSLYCDEAGQVVGMFAAARDIAELKRTEEALRHSEERYRSLFENATVGIYRTTPDGRILMANPALIRMLGYERFEELSTRSLEAEGFEASYPPRSFREAIEREGVVQGLEAAWLKRDGSVMHVCESYRAICGEDGHVLYYDGIAEDITERKEAERRQNLAAEILGILNRAGTLPGTINEILRVVKQGTGFDAVGIRLREGQDYPYFVQEGFSEEFVRRENLLCSRGLDGRLLRDADGHPLLECACGLVLSGQTDPAHPLFTPGGSCWSNDTTTVPELPAEQDSRRQPRNRCLHEGYRSVALVPIRVGEEIVGLLQLNDRRPHRFNADIIRFFEGIGTSIGVALARWRDAEALRASEAEFRRSFDLSPVGTVMVGVGRRMIRCNPAFCRMLGYAEEELRGKDILEITHPDDHEIDTQGIRALLAGQVDRAQVQKRYVSKDGRVVWAEVTMGLVLDKDARPWYWLTIIQDITQRKLAEEALRESEARLQFALETSQMGQWDLDLVDHTARRSLRHARIFGYETLLPEWTYKKFLEHVVPEDVELVDRSFRKSVETQSESDIECRIVRRDQAVRWIHARGRPRWDANGKLRWLAGTVEDVTERKLAEEALRNAEEKFHKAFNASPEPMAIRTIPDGRYVEVNDALLRAAGRRREEVLRKTVTEIGFWMKPEDFTRMTAILERDGKVRDFETDLEWTFGQVNHVLVSAERIELSGEPHQLMVARDITERKRAEQKAAQLAAIVESSNDAIFSANLEGIITSWNKGATLLYGYEESEVIGRNISILVPPGVENDVPQVLQRTQLGEQTENQEAVRQRKDGRRIYVSRTVSPIRDSEGRVVAASTIARDITATRQAQEELRAAHDGLAKEVAERTRAEAEIRALSERLITAQEEERTRLARELHDDLSQQIAAVGIGLSNISRQIPEGLREGREEADRTFRRLQQLGEGIRRLSHHLHPSILEHSGLVVALESYCAEFKSLTGVSAVVQAEARLDNVPANPALGIFRITQEALQNAWKHSGAKKVVIHLARSGGQLCLRVSDQGSGFDPARRPTSKGLGLVSMRERTKLLGGTLTIESAKGQGTTVTAIIPLHSQRSARVSQPKPFLTAAAGSGA